jgi:hypothetical protein
MRDLMARRSLEMVMAGLQRCLRMLRARRPEESTLQW